MAQFLGSKIVRTGVLLGICKVEWMLTNMSVLSTKGGHAIVGKVEFAPTKPDKAFERPEIVI